MPARDARVVEAMVAPRVAPDEIRRDPRHAFTARRHELEPPPRTHGASSPPKARTAPSAPPPRTHGASSPRPGRAPTGSTASAHARGELSPAQIAARRPDRLRARTGRACACRQSSSPAPPPPRTHGASPRRAGGGGPEETASAHARGERSPCRVHPTRPTPFAGCRRRVSAPSRRPDQPSEHVEHGRRRAVARHEPPAARERLDRRHEPRHEAARRLQPSLVRRAPSARAFDSVVPACRSPARPRCPAIAGGLRPPDPPRGKELKNQDSSSIERPRHAKTGEGEPKPGGEPAAVGRTDEPRRAVPRTAAQHTTTTVSTARPRRPVRRRSRVGIMPAVLRPLQHVPQYVEQTERVGTIRTHRNSMHCTVVTGYCRRPTRVDSLPRRVSHVLISTL